MEWKELICPAIAEPNTKHQELQWGKIGYFYAFFIFYLLITVYSHYYFALVLAVAQWSDNYILYRLLPQIFPVATYFIMNSAAQKNLSNAQKPELPDPGFRASC